MNKPDLIRGYPRQEHQKILLSEDVKLVVDCCDTVLNSATALLSTVVNKVIRALSTNIMYFYTAPMDNIERYDLVLETGDILSYILQMAGGPTRQIENLRKPARPGGNNIFICIFPT